eukprot:3945671-Amphidinium_carterae.1
MSDVVLDTNTEKTTSAKKRTTTAKPYSLRMPCWSSDSALTCSLPYCSDKVRIFSSRNVSTQPRPSDLQPFRNNFTLLSSTFSTC